MAPDRQLTPLNGHGAQPEILDVQLPLHRQRLSQIKHEFGHRLVEHDTILEQLYDLAKIEHPQDDLAQPNLSTIALTFLAGQQLEAYGRWVFYPWNLHLVHLLPPDRFRQVRQNRNRYKITADEQLRLSHLTIGIVGLSVGNAIARTLALEGIGGRLRLADFDVLDLSNMNRLHAGVHQIGLNKASLAAQQIYELDPYAEIEAFSEGITDSNLERYFAGPPHIDILVDECDDFEMKLLMREHARSRRIPVIMATSDRGMLDVERFDLEPERPLLHDRLRGVRASDLARLTKDQKTETVLQILRPEALSSRIAASLAEIKRTIVTWPQLASDVFSGAAAVAIAIRRLALGLHLPSGRRYVDIDPLLAEPAYEATADVPLVTSHSDGNLPSAGRFSPSVQVILECAAQAPSGGNCQPWRFSVEGDSIFVFRDESRSKGLRDWNSLASLFAIGAAIENAVIATQEVGHLAEVILFPQRGRKGLIASIEIARQVEPLFPADGRAQIDLIAKRATNRKLGDGSALSQKEMIFLSEAAKHADNSLELIQDTKARIQVGRILGAFDRIQLTVPELNREVVSELRWTREEVDYNRDGIDVGSLELSVSETCALKLIARPDVASILREPGRGVILEEAAVKAMSSSSAVGLLRTRSVTPIGFVQSGRSFQRLWLEATRVGLWIQPWTALTFVARIVDLQDGTIFTEKEKREIRRLRERLDDIFSHQQGWAQVLVFRIFRAPPRSRRSLRRTLDDTVEWTNSTA